MILPACEGVLQNCVCVLERVLM